MVDIINQKLTELGFHVVTMEDASNHIKENYNILMSKENELYNGVTALNDGSRMLKEGIEKYNNEGIAVLYNYSKQVESMESKLKSLVKLGEEYQTFTMKEIIAKHKSSIIIISLIIFSSTFSTWGISVWILAFVKALKNTTGAWGTNWNSFLIFFVKLPILPLKKTKYII